MRQTYPKFKKNKLWGFANSFNRLQSETDLAAMLRLNRQNFLRLTECPKYEVFQVPKKNGKLRTIENPEPELKKAQKTINFYLQATYYFSKTTAAYGFMSSALNEKDPRNIKTNAQKHAGKSWMLNLDFKDFFHQISYNRVVEIFQSSPFEFEAELAHALAKLSTYQGRLPMGAATSPSLSNFACTALDTDLLSFAFSRSQTYTRYADDLTFSSSRKIDKISIKDVKEICHEHDFEINPEKIKRLKPQEPKIVTGLIVGENEVHLSDDYLPKLYQELSKLKTANEIKYRMGAYRADWMSTYQRKIRGSIAFVGFVLGKNHEDYLKLEEAFNQTISPEPQYDPISWLDFGYQF